MTEEAPRGGLEWPAALRRYASGDQLRLTTNGPHPYVWVAAPIALALGGLGLAGMASVGAGGLVSLITGAGAFAFAVAIVSSAAYGVWGSLEIQRGGVGWVVTRRLGRWKTVSSFPGGSVRSAELYSPPPYVVVWPGSAGAQVRLHLTERERPIEVGAGLCLDGDVLRGLQALFSVRP